MDQNEKLTRRLNNVEIALTHLQNDFEALNETVLLFSKRVEQLQANVERLTTQIEQSTEATEPESLEDEKPPHY